VGNKGTDEEEECQNGIREQMRKSFIWVLEMNEGRQEDEYQRGMREQMSFRRDEGQMRRSIGGK
jgi:hypothetical protein